MKCQVCNAEATAGATFCQHCGAKLPSFDGGGAAVKKTAAAGNPGGSQADAPAASQAAAGGAALGRRRGAADVPEEILWEGSYSPKAMLGAAIAAIAASVAILVVGGNYHVWLWALILVVVLWLMLLARLASRRLGISYKLTNQMFYHRRGVLTRTTDRIEAIDIDDVTWQQGLFERAVNVGSIKISSSDRTDPTFWLLGIENVEAVAAMIDKARRAERIRRGLSIESLST